MACGHPWQWKAKLVNFGKTNGCSPRGTKTYVTRPVIGQNLTTWPWAREKSGTCLQCVWQRSTRSIETLMVFQPDPVDFNSWHNPSQAFTEKHVSYPRLTATHAYLPKLHYHVMTSSMTLYCTTWYGCPLFCKFVYSFIRFRQLGFLQLLAYITTSI